MGAQGTDVLLSPAAKKQFPLAIEVKNVEKLNVREAYVQAISHAKPGDKPIVFHTRNRDIMLVTLEAEDFLRLAKSCPHDGCCVHHGSDKAHDERLPQKVPVKEP